MGHAAGGVVKHVAARAAGAHAGAMKTESELVLLGGGHAHVEVLRRLARRPVPGQRLTVIAREPRSPYTGRLPALLRGECSYADAHIDLPRLARAAGARLILAEARAIDLQAKRVLARGQPPIGFDLLSIDVGGQPAMPSAGAVPDGVPVRPLGRLLARLDTLAGTVPAGGRVAVVGAGPAGTELALALARCFAGRWRLVLVGAQAGPVADAPPRARRIVRAALTDAGIELVNGVHALAAQDGLLLLSDDTTLRADATIWATGVVGPGFLARSGLTCDASGCVLVDRSLRSVSHPFVYAAGDCSAVAGLRLARAGVYAVRAGPVLADNLRRATEGRRPRRWHPQRAAMTVLGLGDGRAVAWRGGLAVAGLWVAAWKDWLDARWLARYAPPRQASASRAAGSPATPGQTDRTPVA